MNFSSAVVFIDLANAFHRLVREFVSGVHVPEDIEDVLERLMQEGLPVTEMIELLQLPSLLERLGAPTLLSAARAGPSFSHMDVCARSL